jgi:hypothetical protein
MIPSFTYIEDVDGLIYYSTGLNSSTIQGFVDVILVYYPDEGGNRLAKLHTQSRYSKYVCHGRTIELEEARCRLPPRTFSLVKPMFQHHIETHEQFLSLELTRIAHIYSPKESLVNLLANEDRTSRLSLALNGATWTLRRLGINPNRIGLYGGLQCGIRHPDIHKLHDLDILVEGLDAYEAIVRASDSNVVDVGLFPHRIANHPIERAVAIRRGQISQFKLIISPTDSVVVDLRIVRADLDRNDFKSPTVGPPTFEEIVLLDAEVIDSRQGLSIPCCYTIRAGTKHYIVGSRYYHHLGAAHVGDPVLVKGRLVSDHYIALNDPDTHYVVKRPK